MCCESACVKQTEKSAFLRAALYSISGDLSFKSLSNSGSL